MTQRHVKAGELTRLNVWTEDWVCTCICTCGEVFTAKTQEKDDAVKAARREFQAHLRSTRQ